jgi:ABC-type Fe3+ transport system permease subunit
MPDLLREQFPHFRPIIEAFGYRNLEFDGWEADDVIATLATRADAEGMVRRERLVEEIQMDLQPLGLPVGIEVFTSSMYEAVQSYPSDVGLAATYATLLLAITSGGIYWQSRLSRRGLRFATITGRGYAPRVMKLGRWRALAGAFFSLYAALVIGLPFLVLLWSSLQRFYSVPSLAALKTVSFANYSAVFNYPGISEAVGNTIVLALSNASLVMVLSAVAAWIMLRTRLPGRSCGAVNLTPPAAAGRPWRCRPGRPPGNSPRACISSSQQGSTAPPGSTC